MKKWLVARPPWTYTVIVTLLICYLTLLPKPLPDTGFEWFYGADKVTHAIMFGTLTLAAAFDLRRSGRRRLKLWQLLVIATLSLALGGVVELLQGNYIENRSGDWSDFIGDAIGAYGAIPLVAPLLRTFFNRP